MGVSVQQWRAAIGCWCRGGSSGGTVMSHPMSDVVGAVPLLLLAALLIIGGIESNPGPEVFMFNSELRPALRKLKEEMEQLRSAMEQQTSAMEQQKTVMEQNMSAMEQQKTKMEEQTSAMELQKTAMEQQKTAMEQQKTAMEQLKMALEQQKIAIGQQMTQQKNRMEQQIETKDKTVEQLNRALEQLTDRQTTMELQMEQQDKTVELQKVTDQHMEQQKTLETLVIAAERKRQLDFAFNKLSKEHPSTPHMQQAQAGSTIHRLQVACQLGEKSLVKSLLDEYPDPRDKANFINTDVGGCYAYCLLIASKEGQADIVSLLITLGADVTVRCRVLIALDMTGLMLAASMGHMSVVRVFLDSFSDDKKREDYINIKTNCGQSALLLALHNKRMDIFNLLRESGAKL